MFGRLRAWLSGLFTRSGGSIIDFSGTQRSRSRVDRNERRLLQASEENPNFYSVVDVISRACGRACWRVYRVKGATSRDAVRAKLLASSPLERRRMLTLKQVDDVELEEIPNHPAVEVLKRGNKLMHGTDARVLIQWYLEVTGFCFVAVGSSELSDPGAPFSIWPFPRFALQDRTEATNKVVFELDGSRYTFNQDRVFMIRCPQPSRPYQLTGTGLGRALATEISIDEGAAMVADGRLLHDGKPDVLIAASGLEQAGMQSLRAQFEMPGGKVANAGRVFFTNVPVDLKVERLTDSLADLGLAELRAESGDMIRQTPGVPPEILGRVENSNRATSAVAAFHFHENVVDPRLAKTEEALNISYLPMFPDSEGLVLAYDSTIPSDEEFALEVSSKHPDALSRNEVRAIAGYGPTDNEEDDELPGLNLTGTQIAAMFVQVILPYNAGTLSEAQAAVALQFVYHVPPSLIPSFLTAPEKTDEAEGSEDEEDSEEDPEDGADEGDEEQGDEPPDEEPDEPPDEPPDEGGSAEIYLLPFG